MSGTPKKCVIEQIVPLEQMATGTPTLGEVVDRILKRADEDYVLDLLDVKIETSPSLINGRSIMIKFEAPIVMTKADLKELQQRVAEGGPALAGFEFGGD